MRQAVRAQLYSVADFSSVDICRALVEHLRRAPRSPSRYDAVENARRDFAGSSVDEINGLLRDRGVIFFKFENGAAQVMIQREATKFFLLHVFFVEKEWYGEKSKEWEEWIDKLADITCSIYGYICTDEEYNIKNIVVDELSTGGLVIRGAGIATSDFYHFIPGVYWKNYFVSAIRSDIDLSKIERMTDWDLQRVSDDIFAIRWVHPLLPFEPRARQQADQDLIAALGEEHVFVKGRPQDNLRQFAALANRIK